LVMEGLDYVPPRSYADSNVDLVDVGMRLDLSLPEVRDSFSSYSEPAYVSGKFYRD